MTHKTMIAVLIVSLACACSEKPHRTAEELQVEKQDKFAKFQKFVDSRSKGWLVTAIRESFDVSSSDGENYYVALQKETAEKVVVLRLLEFTMTDGTTETKVYEPTQPGKRCADPSENEPPEGSSDPWA